MTADELRSAVVEAAREMLRLGLVPGSSGNASARDGPAEGQRAVVHTHSVHAMAWSFIGEPLATGTEELAAAAGGEVLTARFAPTGLDEIAAAVVEALGDRRPVLLARHGAVAVGETPAAALATCVALERQAQIGWLLRG
jgi:ribulose-5-phosphate 4-epimerase/fuculose-1-phosphate aldolase